MKERGKYIYVDPLFKKKLKGIALENNTSLFRLTKELGRDEDILNTLKAKNGKKIKSFGFNFP